MKKIFLPLIIAAILPSLSACKDEAHGIVAIKSFNKSFQFIELKREQFVNLVESGQEFLFEFYSSTCGHCEDLEPLLEKYSSSTGNIIYRIEATKVLGNDELEDLTKKYTGVFIDNFVPHVSFVKDKALTYDVPDEPLENYNQLKRSIDKHLISSKINMVNNYNDYVSYTNSKKDYLIYSYDLDNQKSLEIAYQNIINKQSKYLNKDIILLNKAGFASDFDKIQTSLNVSNTTFCALVKSKEVTKTIDYLTDGNLVNEMLSNL